MNLPGVCDYIGILPGRRPGRLETGRAEDMGRHGGHALRLICPDVFRRPTPNKSFWHNNLFGFKEFWFLKGFAVAAQPSAQRMLRKQGGKCLSPALELKSRRDEFLTPPQHPPARGEFAAGESRCRAAFLLILFFGPNKEKYIKSVFSYIVF